MEDFFEIKGDKGESAICHLLACNKDGAIGEITFSSSYFSSTRPVRFNDYEIDFSLFCTALKSLYETLKGSAKFGLFEGQFEMAMVGNGRGSIEAQGFLQPDSGENNKLEFQFNLDQTFLPPLIEQLEELMKKYPASNHEGQKSYKLVSSAE